MASADPITQVAVDRQSLLESGRSSREVAGHGLHAAQQVQSPGLAWPVAGLATRGKSSLMQGKGLLPVALNVQEVGHGGGDQHGVQGPPTGGCIAGGRMQVGALSLQPGGCLPGRGYRRRAGRRPGGG
jgi:hypothetical protein